MDAPTPREHVDELPPALAVALRLHEAGHPDAVVATALDIPIEGVAPLLTVARAKLEHLPGPGQARPDRPQDQWLTTEGGTQHRP